LFFVFCFFFVEKKNLWKMGKKREKELETEKKLNLGIKKAIWRHDRELKAKGQKPKAVDLIRWASFAHGKSRRGN